MEWATPVNAMALTNEWTRVVVLTPPTAAGGGLSEGLKRLFAARDWFAVEQHDPYLAMAELCLRERAQVARSAWGLQRMELIAMVVMQPEQWPKLQELVDAVHQFVPTATIWSASPNDTVSPLSAIARESSRTIDRSTSRQQEVIVEPSAPADAALAALVVEPHKSAAAASQRISREEIDMLLNMEWAGASEVEGDS